MYLMAPILQAFVHKRNVRFVAFTLFDVLSDSGMAGISPFAKLFEVCFSVMQISHFDVFSFLLNPPRFLNHSRLNSRLYGAISFLKEIRPFLLLINYCLLKTPLYPL